MLLRARLAQVWDQASVVDANFVIWSSSDAFHAGRFGDMRVQTILVVTAPGAQ